MWRRDEFSSRESPPVTQIIGRKRELRGGHHRELQLAWSESEKASAFFSIEGRKGAMVLPPSSPWLFLYFLFGGSLRCMVAQATCAFTLRVYETFDQCEKQELPNATEIIYADGQCRTMDNVDAVSTYFPHLPQNYHAMCTTNGFVRIREDGCAACSSTTDCDQTRADENNLSKARGLLVSQSSLLLHLNEDGASPDSSVSCFPIESGANGKNITFTYTLVGNCAQPDCQEPDEPVSRTTHRSLSSPTPTAPLTWRRITPSPTAPPKTITAIRLTHFPTPSTVVAASSATVPMPTSTTTPPQQLAPSRTPTTPSDTVITTTIRSSCGLQLSEMHGFLDATVLAYWTDVTEQHIVSQLPEQVQTARIEHVAQQWTTMRSRRLPSWGITTRRTSPVGRAAALKLRFNVTMIVAYENATGVPESSSSSSAIELNGDDHLAEKLFAEAFDEEKERIQYVRELVRRDAAAFESLNQIMVLGHFHDTGADKPTHWSPSSSSIAPTLDRGDYILPLTLLIVFIVSFWILGGLCITVYAIRRRRCIAHANADADTADMTSMYCSTIHTPGARVTTA